MYVWAAENRYHFIIYNVEESNYYPLTKEPQTEQELQLNIEFVWLWSKKLRPSFLGRWIKYWPISGKNAVMSK
jgi:hypothetical protein